MLTPTIESEFRDNVVYPPRRRVLPDSKSETENDAPDRVVATAMTSICVRAES